MTKYAKGDVLYVPVIEQIDLFIDDTGDNDIGVEGFSVLLIDQYAREDIRNKIAYLMKQEGITTIHVSRMSSNGLKRILSASMNILDAELRRATYGYLRWMLSPSDTIRTLTQQMGPFVAQVLRKGREEVAAPYDIGEMFTRLALPVLEVLRHTSCSKEIKINIFIENKGHYRRLFHRKMFMGSVYVEIKDVMKSLLQSYMTRAHNITCTVGSLSIVKSGASPLIDLMDVVGNMTLNFFRSTLQLSAGMLLSKNARTKLRIFEEVLIGISGEEHTNVIREKIRSSFSLAGKSLTPLNPNELISVFEIMQSE
jgi:hypothetical protein